MDGVKLICTKCNKEIKNPNMWGSAIFSGHPVVKNGMIYPNDMYVDPDDHGYVCEHCGENIPNGWELESQEMKDVCVPHDID